MGEMPGVRAPPHVPLWGAVCKWEVGLVSLGKPQQPTGSRMEVGRDFQEMDDSPSRM